MSNLIFSGTEIVERRQGLTFDDVLLIPSHSEISSRRDPNTKARITKNFELDIPIVTANMDTVTESQMACTMARMGGLGILHRFMSVKDQIKEIQIVKKFQEYNEIKLPISASIGVKEDGKNRADILADIGIDILTIDIAHGDSIMMLKTLEYVKKRYPNIDVIAGNIAYPSGVRRLIDAGADSIKIGIGPGSMCTTRVMTGCGVPQLTAVAMCAEEALKDDIPIIADGGIKTSGDIVKALCAGASCIMLGSMVSGCMETPGEIKGGKKKYRGMASKDAQVSWRGELPKGMAAEGVSRWIPCKGSVENVVDELTGGLRSGMSYLNAQSLKEMKSKARFMQISSSGLFESRAFGEYDHAQVH